MLGIMQESFQLSRIEKKENFDVGKLKLTIFYSTRSPIRCAPGDTERRRYLVLELRRRNKNRNRFQIDPNTDCTYAPSKPSRDEI